ncbi:MAG: hypothetical protein MZV63_16035 [Marinilabiliales bacterium]|nr:hypothetical protein [Marinilabiliales bacterium]
MKILILTHSYPDSIQKWRGIFIREQAEALSSIHDVIVVYFRVDYSVFAPFSAYSFVKNERGRITEYEVTTNRSLPVISQLKYLKDTYSFIAKEILETTKPDIIHSHLSYPAGIPRSYNREKEEDRDCTYRTYAGLRNISGAPFIKSVYCMP